MKQKLYTAALCLLIANAANAQESQDQFYFDWNGQAPHELLEAFKTGGSEAIATMKDLEFKRSHVRVKDIIVDQSTQLDPSIDPRRSFWFNCPIGASGFPKTAMPTDRFDDDVFSMWQYVKIHGNWSNEWFCAPAAFSDAAHKHGTAVLSTWGIPWAWNYIPGSTQESDYISWFFDKLTEKDQQDKFIYAEPLINLLMYLGLDGINYNSEFICGQEMADKLKALHEELYRLAKEKNFVSFHIGWYDGVENNGSMRYIDQLGYHNNQWLANEATNATVSDAFMLNYNWGHNKLQSTVKTAKELMLPNGAYDVYAGCWIVHLTQAWYAVNNNPEVSIAFWGEHKQNRIFQHRNGLDEKRMQENYQDRLEWVFTGGNQNPNPSSRLPISVDADLSGSDESVKLFHGISRFIAERSTVNGNLPFATNFILGNGQFYNVEGEKTYGTWYNMSAQDVCPTYRWLITDNAGNTVTNFESAYSFDEAWIGGSSLKLSGAVGTARTNVHLYRSDLSVGSNPKVKLVYKVENGVIGQSSNLKFIYKKNNQEQWQEVAMGQIAKQGWNEVELPLADLSSNDKITGFGIGVQAGESITSYTAYIGELKISDDKQAAVNAPQDFVVEYMNETDKHIDVKFFWKMALAEAGNRLIYNDEVNTAYFEVFVKENGVQRQVARTSAWAHFIPAIEITPGVGELQVGVRAISTDLNNASEIIWKTITRDPNAPIEPEKDLYCEAINDPQSDGVEVAQTNRFVETASTSGAITNLSFSGTATSNGYVAYTGADKAIEAEAGTSFQLNAIASGRRDGMKYCKVTIYADWNQDGIFDPETEICDEQGTDRAGDDRVATLLSTINVPAKAVSGLTRLRLRYSDAWFPQPGPCGLAQKGYSLDLSVKVVGGITGMNQVSSNAPSFYPNPVIDNVTFSNVEKVSIFGISGKLIESIDGAGSYDLSHLPSGVYIVNLENEGVSKSVKMIKK